MRRRNSESSRTHEPNLRELVADLDGLRDLMEERDKRYEERDAANKEAVRAALASAEKASEKTELALKEYKTSANEWRDTVKDLVAQMPSRNEFAAQAKSFDQQITSLSEKIADLRESRSAGSGAQTTLRHVKDDSRANLAIGLSVLGLIGMWVLELVKALKS